MRLVMEAIIIIIIMVAQPGTPVASLHHHVHGRQHASRGLQWDGGIVS